MSKQGGLSGRAKRYRLWRNIWGVLALLPLLWLCYGFSVTGDVFGEQIGVNATQAAAGTLEYQGAADLGTTIGAGITSTFVLCTALPLLLFFLFFSWRNGVAMGREVHHAETISAIKGGHD